MCGWWKLIAFTEFKLSDRFEYDQIAIADQVEVNHVLGTYEACFLSKYNDKGNGASYCIVEKSLDSNQWHLTVRNSQFHAQCMDVISE